MSEISAKIYNLKLLDKKEVMIYLDSNEISGDEVEVFELKVHLRVVAEMFDLDKEDVRKSREQFNSDHEFKETKEFIKNWSRDNIIIEKKTMSIE